MSTRARTFANLMPALALHRKRAPTNRALFARFRVAVAAMVAQRVRDGDDVADYAGVVLDVDDTQVPPLLAAVAMDGEPADVRLHAMVMDRGGVAGFFDEARVRKAIAKPSKLDAYPVLVVANGKVSVHRLVVEPERWVEGGDA